MKKLKMNRRKMNRRKLEIPGRNSIKEAFDNLPSGMCYFDQNGMPLLVNYTMDRLVYELLGQDLQYETELQKCIAGLPDQIYISGDETVWKFHRKKLEGYGTEYIASDITEIYQNNELLHRKNQQLQEMNTAIEAIGRNYVAIAREEEILSMKMRIHSEMGKCSLYLQKFYRDGCPSNQKDDLIRQLRRGLQLLKGEVGKTDEEDPAEELKKAASAIGAQIVQKGELPPGKEERNLLVLAMRECLINAIRHGKGDTLYVAVDEHSDGWYAEITNNGQPPEAEITEGGGLSSLRQKIESAGGRMSVISSPAFCLRIFISVEKTPTSISGE